MFEDDRSYFQRRAEDELARAQQATSTRVVKAHYELAQAYLEKVAAVEVPGKASA